MYIGTEKGCQITHRKDIKTLALRVHNSSQYVVAPSPNSVPNLKQHYQLSVILISYPIHAYRISTSTLTYVDIQRPCSLNGFDLQLKSTLCWNTTERRQVSDHCLSVRTQCVAPTSMPLTITATTTATTDITTYKVPHRVQCTSNKFYRTSNPGWFCWKLFAWHGQ